MVIGEDQRQRPYAAPANVISVLQRVRTRNLPERIDDDLLRLVGVPEGALHRVHTAFRFFGLVDDDQTPTDTLRALAAATDEQYRQILAGAIKAAYQEDFQRIDPAKDTQAQIVDAFRPYQPRSQTNRMVILFLGLCREAGIPVLDAPRERGPQSPRPRRSTPTPRTATAPRRPRNQSLDEQLFHASDLLFGLTEDDVAVLDEVEFNEVWTALGKVARARARAKHRPAAEASPPPEAVDGD
jgi:hypothetical protein